MSAFDWLKGKPKPARHPEARDHNVSIQRDRFDKDALLARGLRRNMWVVPHGHGVGILTDYTKDHIATVMLVDEHGDNLAQVVCQGSTVRQALTEEIPGPRRPTPDVALAKGYTRF